MISNYFDDSYKKILLEFFSKNHFLKASTKHLLMFSFMFSLRYIFNYYKMKMKLNLLIVSNLYLSLNCIFIQNTA